MKNKELLKQEEKAEPVLDIICEKYKAAVEGITGIVSAERKDWALSAGFILQKVRGGKFLYALKKEWDMYKNKGRIPDDYVDTEQNEECLAEILDYLDKDLPNEITFDLLKKIYLIASTEKISTRESYMPQQWLKIVRKLSAGAIIVLMATYNIAKEKREVPDYPHFSAVDWLKQIADATGLKYPELIELHEHDLIEKKLLTERFLSDKSGIQAKPSFRLTQLGFEICEYVENYEK